MSDKKEVSLEKIELSKIVLHPLFRMRDKADEQKIEELVDDIEKRGLINPISVRAIDENKYELFAGSRRYAAFKLLSKKDAKWLKIDTRIFPFDEKQAYFAAVSENFQREDITPIEEAEFLQRGIKELKLTQNEIAKQIGKSIPYVSNRLRLLKLDPQVTNLIKEGKISAGHAEHGLLKLVDHREEQKELAKEIVKENLDVQQAGSYAKDYIRNIKKKEEFQTLLKSPKSKFPKCPNCKQPVRERSWRGGNYVQCGNYHEWDVQTGKAYRSEYEPITSHGGGMVKEKKPKWGRVIHLDNDLEDFRKAMIKEIKKRNDYQSVTTKEFNLDLYPYGNKDKIKVNVGNVYDTTYYLEKSKDGIRIQINNFDTPTKKDHDKILGFLKKFGKVKVIAKVPRVKPKKVKTKPVRKRARKK